MTGDINYDGYKFNQTTATVVANNTALSKDICSKCSARVGRWIDPNFEYGVRNGPKDSLPLCPARYQCVTNSEKSMEGCCMKCSFKHFCPAGTIGIGNSLTISSWNRCPDGHICKPDPETNEMKIKKCEAGYICKDNHKMSCKDVRQIPIDQGYGDIHAGSFCPEGSSDLLFCKQGHYCPADDMSVSKPCEAGYFCPLKTSKPSLRCKGCKEGAFDLATFPFLTPLLYILNCIIVLILINFCVSKKFIKPYRRKEKEKEKECSKKTKTDESTDDDIEYDYLFEQHRVAHILDLIQDRINNMSVRNVDFGTFDLHDDFNVEALFEQLDMDCDNVLSYDELNVILQLSDKQIKYFVQMMNRKAEVNLANETVCKSVFVDHFYDCLSNATCIDPTAQEAAQIFDRLDLNQDGYIQGVELHTSPINEFLSSAQIQKIIKNFRNKLDGSGYAPLCIHKEDFIKYYPTLLNDVAFQEAQKSRGIDIAFEELKLTTKLSEKKIKIVDSLTGRIQESSMTAIMGGSGAGKTSLLNALCGRAFYGEVSGKIMINGNEGRIEDHKNFLGFVPQDDIMYGELTVLENLLYSGRFRLPRGTSYEEIAELAEEIIASLGLVKVRNSIVGNIEQRGISGGEKKRVNIGLELMSKPRILFLDEPTSGLDASSSSLVVGSLRALLDDNGVTIVSVIHQPRKSVYDLFDNIILLGSGGKMVYHGPAKDAEVYFKTMGYTVKPGENVADWMIDISTGCLGLPPKTDIFGLISDKKKAMKRKAQSIHLDKKDYMKLTNKFLYDHWEEYFQLISKNNKAQYSSPKPFMIPAMVKKPSFFSQFFIQLQRNVLVFKRNIRSHLLDMFIISIAITVTVAISGTFQFVGEDYLEQDLFIPLSNLATEDASKLPLDKMFRPYQAAASDKITDGLQIAVIGSVLVGLAATKAISGKKLEFLRESSSGYNIDAYYLAITLVMTIEHSIQLIFAGLICGVIRSTPSSWCALIINFIMLGWVCVSWAILFSVIVPPKNLTIVTGFFMAFFGLLFGGAISPVEYEDIYSKLYLEILSGFLAPTRYFIETFVVSDFKCLPVQTGFTSFNSTRFPAENKSFFKNHLGQRDPNVGNHSCNGWYWGFLPSFFLGLSIRILAMVLMHAPTPMLQRNSYKLPLLKGTRKWNWKSGKYPRLMMLLLVFMPFVTFNFIVAKRDWVFFPGI